MPRYSHDMVMERSPFWFPRRAVTITGSGTYDDPFVVPGSPVVECPAPPAGAPSAIAWNSHQLNLHLLTQQIKRDLKMGSQEGSIN